MACTDHGSCSPVGACPREVESRSRLVEASRLARAASAAKDVTVGQVAELRRGIEELNVALAESCARGRILRGFTLRAKG